MFILTHQRFGTPLTPLLLIFPNSGDINEQTRGHIDPAGIDPIQGILRRLDNVVGIDLEHVRAAAVDIGDIEMMLSHIVVVC
jgi:hypothetical protein